MRTLYFVTHLYIKLAVKQFEYVSFICRPLKSLWIGQQHTISSIFPNTYTSDFPLGALSLARRLSRVSTTPADASGNQILRRFYRIPRVCSRFASILCASECNKSVTCLLILFLKDSKNSLFPTASTTQPRKCYAEKAKSIHMLHGNLFIGT